MHRGTCWVSQVLWCLSSHMPRSFPTPADPRQPHPDGCSVLASVLAKTIAICFFASLTRLFQASGSAVSLTAYVLPCVRLNRYVRAFDSPPHGCNTRYEWLVRPCSTGTLTQSETPSFAWRTSQWMLALKLGPLFLAKFACKTLRLPDVIECQHPLATANGSVLCGHVAGDLVVEFHSPGF
jgi:hypothetical protein